VEARLRLASEEWAERGYGLMAVVERESGRFVGRAGLRYWPQFDEAELGWALHQDVWGLGYATEAGRACMEWGLGELGLPYVTAMIQPVNLRSIKVAQQLGLEPLREDVLLGDDVIVYARSRASWPDGG
jgi:RimJ/RimL family protein N-acetyltransferase